jgi:hypothetical protein
MDINVTEIACWFQINFTLKEVNVKQAVVAQPSLFLPPTKFLTVCALKTKLRGFRRQELYRPSDRRLSAKLVPTFADKGCRVVSATDPHGR